MEKKKKKKMGRKLEIGDENCKAGNGWPGNGREIPSYFCNGKKEIGMQEHKMEEMTELKWVLKDLNLAETVI